MNSSKRITALLMVCLLVCGLFSVSAAAAEPGLAIDAAPASLDLSAGLSSGAAAPFAVTPYPEEHPLEYDENEPNNSIDLADPIYSNQARWGYISDANTDLDYYRVIMTEPGLLSTSMIAADPNIVYSLYAEDGTTHIDVSMEDTPTADGDYVQRLNRFMPAGTYYLVVLNLNDNEPLQVQYLLYFCERPYVNPFNDVSPSDYYYEPVMWADTVYVTSGTTATTFSPHDPCSRAQIVTFLWRYAGCPTPQSSYNPFVDVPDNDYYTEAVLWAVENGITSGMTYNTFEPNATCNRAQMVTFLWRAYGSPAPAYGNSFADVPTGEYYDDPVSWAVENGITTGFDSYTFGSGSPCSRADAVTFLYRAP